jgi:hypothetical protein
VKEVRTRLGRGSALIELDEVLPCTHGENGSWPPHAIPEQANRP